MQLISKQLNIDFMGRRRVAVVVSAVLVVIAVGALIARGLNFGIDFTGGTLVEVRYSQAVELSEVRKALTQAGFTRTVVQHFGTSHEVLVRVAPESDAPSDSTAVQAPESAAPSNTNAAQAEEDAANKAGAAVGARVLAALQKASSQQLELRRSEFVGPQVGEELREQGGLAVLYALICILIYVALRFEYRFSVGSVAALVHDVVITLGVFALTQVEFDLSVLAALLAVIGYSLNDTIVVFDRIRENFRKVRKGTAVQVVNRSVNETLARTLMTSFTTLLVLLALFFLGGEVIHGFSLALIVGVLVGTYSSIYVASTAALALGVSKQDLMPVKKEGAEADSSRL